MNIQISLVPPVCEYGIWRAACRGDWVQWSDGRRSSTCWLVMLCGLPITGVGHWWSVLTGQWSVSRRLRSFGVMCVVNYGIHTRRGGLRRLLYPTTKPAITPVTQIPMSALIGVLENHQATNGFKASICHRNGLCRTCTHKRAMSLMCTRAAQPV